MPKRRDDHLTNRSNRFTSHRPSRYLALEEDRFSIDEPDAPGTPIPGGADGLWCYFAKAPWGEIKIGISANPRSRVDNLSGSIGRRLEYLGCIPGNPQTERALHKRFKEYRVGGEWFDDVIEGEIMELLGTRAHRWPDGRSSTDETQRRSYVYGSLTSR